MTGIAEKNFLFDRAVSRIVSEARIIESATHLFSSLSLHQYDTALDRLDLRLSAIRLREAADKIDDIAERLQGPATAFPDYNAMSEAAE